MCETLMRLYQWVLFILVAVSQPAFAVSDPDFNKQVERIRKKAFWLLDNPAYDIADDANTRFNSRRCMRIVTETSATIDFANQEGLPPIDVDSVERLKKRAIETIRKVVYQKPVRWYAPFNPRNPIEKTLEMAEMAACLGIALRHYDEYLERDLRSDLVDMLATLLERYHSSYEPLFSDSKCRTACKSNWNGVINSAAVIAAVAVRNEPDLGNLGSGQNILIATVQKARKALPRFYGLFSTDGSYPEGPVYINFPMEYIAVAHEYALEATGSGIGMESFLGALNSGRYLRDMMSPFSEVLKPSPLTDDAFTYNFSDTNSKIRPSLTFLSWLGYRFGQTDMTALANQIARAPIGSTYLAAYGNGTMEALALQWYVPSARMPARRSTSYLYGAGSDTQVGFLVQRISDGKYISATIKGGKPAMTPHGHLDSGSILFEANQRRWTSDLGPELYAADGYFETNPALSPNRWQYLRANNLGHTTLTIDKKIQNKDAFSNISLDSNRSAAKIDLSAAYAATAKRVERHVALYPDSSMTVRDTLHLKNSNSVVESRFIYCKQKSAMVANTGDSSCSRDSNSNRSFAWQVDPITIRVTEDDLTLTSCAIRWIDIVLTPKAGQSIQLIRLDPADPANSIAASSPNLIQSNNPDCAAVVVTSTEASPNRLIQVNLAAKQSF
jgi:Heparinase II/III-like protein